MSLLLFAIYVLSAVVLAIYSLNYLITAGLYLRRPVEQDKYPKFPEFSRPGLPAAADPSSRPRVTVQLPTYDELYVVGRLIDAAAALEWPRDRLQIQVLDDSDDETTTIARKRVEHFQRLGIDISVYRRADRSGFKAGALAAGLAHATGEYIAIFDADFVPPRDFLKRTIPHLLADPGIGLIQTRWGHLNARHSPLTRAQAIAIDGHFAVEQAARSAHGLCMNFNGTAGVWRRACIEAAGGWHADTLTEDLDLSYRAQLAGWRFKFLPDVVCPAELPPQIHAFRRQQFRWAKGSTQCLVKLAPRILSAPGFSPFKRFQGLVHLSGYLMNPLMVLLLLASIPLIALNAHLPAAMMYFTLAACGPIMLYALAQHVLYRDWLARMRYFPVLMLLGTGLSLSGSLAVVDALLGRGNNFRRTPKFRMQDQGDTWDEKRYRLSSGPEAIGELVLAAYALLGIALAWLHHSYWAIPFLALYAAGFGTVFALGLWHSRPAPHRNTGPRVPSDLAGAS